MRCLKAKARLQIRGGDRLHSFMVDAERSWVPHPDERFLCAGLAWRTKRVENLRKLPNGDKVVDVVAWEWP